MTKVMFQGNKIVSKYMYQQHVMSYIVVERKATLMTTNNIYGSKMQLLWM